MPLNIRRLSASLSLVLLFAVSTFSQAPTTADVIRGRVSKAKGFVAVKNYAAAIYELEGIKRETNDPTVNSVIQVMLMNCYLEQLDYKRAQTLLTEVYNAQKSNKPNSNYFAVAGQVVKVARNQLDRYKSLGLSVSDRNLPTEAVADVERMREIVEMVVTHSKALGENKKLTTDSMALLEEASNARGNLARDEYDAKRWKEELADVREVLSASRTTIINSVNDDPPNTIDTSKTLATNSTPTYTPTSEPASAKIIPASDSKTESATPPTLVKETVLTDIPKTESATNKDVPKTELIANKEQTEKTVKDETAKNQTQESSSRDRLISNQNPTQVADEQPKLETQPVVSNPVVNTSPLQVGSLLEYATDRVSPTYPPAARTMRMTGTVKVEVLVSEDGSIAEVQNASGPSMLQRAATDAIKRWKFKPFTRDGQPVKATGYVSFNFNL